MNPWRWLFRSWRIETTEDGRQAEADAAVVEQQAKLEHTRDVVQPGYARRIDQLGAQVEKALRSIR